MANELERAQRFARELQAVYGEELVSVVLYGSAARGEYQEGVSDLNLLVLLRDADAAALRRGSALARGWVQQGNPPPLLLPAEEWRGSADVFPIEYADMRDAHRVLHGADPFTGIEIQPRHLRLQCESELKGKQIQLRERYLLSAGEPDELRELLTRSVSTFLVLFRTVLRLTGDAVPRPHDAVVRATAERVGFDAAPLLQILEARRGAGTLRPGADDAVVTGYLEAVARTVAFVDRL